MEVFWVIMKKLRELSTGTEWVRARYIKYLSTYRTALHNGVVLPKCDLFSFEKHHSEE